MTTGPKGFAMPDLEGTPSTGDTASSPALVMTLLGDLLVGVDLQRIDAISVSEQIVPSDAPRKRRIGTGNDADASRVPSSKTRRVDLARLLGTGEPAKDGRTLVARASDGATCEVLAGDAVKVLAAEAARIQPLPELLEGLTHRAAICGLFFIQEKIGFLLDAERLVELSSGGEGERGGGGAETAA